MPHQTEVGLHLVVAYAELGRMATRPPQHIEAAAADLEAVARLAVALALIRDCAEVGEHDRQSAAVAQARADHMLDVCTERIHALQERDTQPTISLRAP